MKSKIGQATYWYWVASYYNKGQKKELYSESAFGPDTARELAHEALRVEKEFAKKLKVKELTAVERKAIRSARRAAFSARQKVICAKPREDVGLIRGVNYDSKRGRYVAKCLRHKKRLTKGFAVKKYGAEEARQMAIDWRHEMERKRESERRSQPDSLQTRSRHLKIHLSLKIGSSIA